MVYTSNDIQAPKNNLFEFNSVAGTVVYNAYINGLIRGRNTSKAVEIFQRMKSEQCQPSTDTYTMLINLYGKVRLLMRPVIQMSVSCWE